MLIVVRPFIILSRDFWTLASFYGSSAEVASSRSKILGFRRIVLAIAIRCFCPPDTCEPLAPTHLPYPS
jgi:hypothetical protein